MLAKVSTGTGSVDRWSPDWNPTPHLDLYSDLILSGSNLYGSGCYGYTESLDSAQGFITKIRTADLTREWTATPSGIKAVFEIDVDSAGGIIAIAFTATAQYVMRCLDDGTCP